MALYLNELTPWERKNEYYHAIQLGEDVRIQTEAINNSTKAMVATQIASTNAIIASQERINKGIDKFAYGIERVEEGIYGLQAAFEWGISEIVWQIEQNREVLKSILEVLMAPLDTQAKERRKRAENAYSNGWIDDAEEEFLESEKLNRYDFAIHISLGMIYLFSKIDKEKALEYFEKAIKYARPESNYHTSYALIYKGLIMRDYERIEEAEKCTAEAVELSPGFAEALYQNAQYNARLKDVQKSLANLVKAIKLDKNYCLKADKDEMFDPIRSEVNKLFERLRDEAINLSINLRRNIEAAIKEANEIIHNSPTFNNSSFNIEGFNTEITEINKLIEGNSYFDGLDVQPKAKSLIESAKGYFSGIANKIESEIKDIPKKDKDKTNKKRERLQRPALVIAIVTLLLSGCFLVITVAVVNDPNTNIVWMVPIFLFGGGFIAIIVQAILRSLGHLIYAERDFSQFIAEKQREKSEIEKCRNKLSAIVPTGRTWTHPSN